jgi:hypothetical protein
MILLARASWRNVSSFFAEQNKLAPITSRKLSETGHALTPLMANSTVARRAGPDELPGKTPGRMSKFADEPDNAERCPGVDGKCLRMSQATRRNVTDAYIESFVQAFEFGSLSRSEWTHSRHLIMALWYLRSHRRDEATTLIRDGIRRHNECQENFTGYHETITLAWVAVIERFLGVRGSAWFVVCQQSGKITGCGLPLR